MPKNTNREPVTCKVSNDKGTLTIVIPHGDHTDYAHPVSKKTGKVSASGLVAEIGSRFGAMRIPGTNLKVTLYVGCDDGETAPKAAGFTMG